MSDRKLRPDILTPGQELGDGKYLIKEELGAGAMGTVYRGEHRALKRDVAIKVMHPMHFARQPKAVLRFEREARAAAQLDHRNSVRVLDFGIEDSVHYLVMEFVEGRPLDKVVAEEGPFDSRRIAVLMGQACSALVKAHAAGTIHRDLKPQNILLVEQIDDEGLPTEMIKVCDFGIAKVSWTEPDEDIDALTEAGSVIGTPQYMSPEQCQAEELDARSDIYSLGCVMYFLATGQHPFSGPTPLTTMLMQIQETPRPPRELNPGLDPAIEALILETMAKNRSDRPSSAGALRRQLGELVGLRSSEAHIPPTRPASSDAQLGVLETQHSEAGISAISSDVMDGTAPNDRTGDPQTLHTASGRGHLNRLFAIAAGLIIGLASLIIFALNNTPSSEVDNVEQAARSSKARPALVEPALVSKERGPTPAAPTEVPATPPVASANAANSQADNPTDKVGAAPSSPTETPALRSPVSKRRTPKASQSNAKVARERPRKERDRKTPKETKKKPSVATSPPQAPPPAPAIKPPTPPPAIEPAKATPITPPVKEAKVVSAESEKVAPAKPAAPKSFGATVRIGGFKVAGSLPKSAIIKATRHLIPGFRRCYEQAARTAGRVATVTITVHGTIDEDGRIKRVRAGGSGLPGLAGCVKGAAGRLRSRTRPDTGTVDASFEVRFNPKG